MSRISKIKHARRVRERNERNLKIKHAMKLLANSRPVAKSQANVTPKRLAAAKKREGL